MLTKFQKTTTKKTRRSPSFCTHFDYFDQILGTRDFVNPPFATQVDLHEHGKNNADDHLAAGNEGKNCISITQ